MPSLDIGGKARALATLLGVQEVAVPQAVAIPLAGYLDDAEDAAALSCANDVVAELQKLLAPAIDDLFAVRSSGVAEDARGSSLAGHFLTLTRVALVDLPASICTVALDLRRRQGKRGGSVVVQLFVEAVVGGVMFTANPLDGNRSQYIIEGAPGAVSGVAGGSVTPERWVLSDRGEIEGFTPGDFSSDDRDRILHERQLTELVDLGRRVTSLFGHPQDIEWAIDRERRLWTLQARPITTL